MSIHIGDKNKIRETIISEDSNINLKDRKADKKFANRHPILISIIVSFVVGFILLLSFWTNIINWIEGLFK